MNPSRPVLFYSIYRGLRQVGVRGCGCCGRIVGPLSLVLSVGMGPLAAAFLLAFLLSVN